MKIRTKLIGTIAVGAALLAPVAQAQSPDDRTGARGPGAIAATQASAVTRPDDLAGARGPASIGSQIEARGPDDRAGARGPGSIEAPEFSAAPRPDDRTGARGPGAVGATVAQPASTGFDWGDALVGALGGAGVALLLIGSAFLLTSQRTKVRTA